MARLPARQADEVVEKVIEAVADGSTVAKALEKLGNPIARRTFQYRVLHNPELLKRWEAAKEMRAHAMFDEAVDLAHKLKDGSWGKDSSAMVRALDRAVTAFFYAAARLNPREYGERVAPTPITPIVIKTTLNLGQDGREASKAESIYTLKPQPVVDAVVEPSTE